VCGGPCLGDGVLDMCRVSDVHYCTPFVPGNPLSKSIESWSA
jgi:hypothetical protein